MSDSKSDIVSDAEIEKRKPLINEILQTCKANDVPTTGDLFFSLAFRTEAELKDIAQDLHIKI